MLGPASLTDTVALIDALHERYKANQLLLLDLRHRQPLYDQLLAVDAQGLAKLTVSNVTMLRCWYDDSAQLIHNQYKLLRLVGQIKGEDQLVLVFDLEQSVQTAITLATSLREKLAVILSRHELHLTADY